MKINGEFVFHFTEKVDRDGKKYLFAGIPFFNAVLFVWPEPETPGVPRRWKAIAYPHIEGYSDLKRDESAWTDERKKT